MNQGGSGCAESVAHADLMSEAYAHLVKTEHRAARNDMCKRKHWVSQPKTLRWTYMADDAATLLRDPRFGAHGWRFQYSNQQASFLIHSSNIVLMLTGVERKPLSLFSMFSYVLLEYRGKFLPEVSQLVSKHIQKILNRRDLSRKYVLKNMDGDHLKQEPLDSCRFVKYCGSEVCEITSSLSKGDLKWALHQGERSLRV